MSNAEYGRGGHVINLEHDSNNRVVFHLRNVQTHCVN